MEIEPSDIGEDDYISSFKTIPQHKTRILPLRWFANFCNVYPANWALRKALREEYKVEDTDLPLSKAGHRWWKIYSILNAPYERWGTTHLVIDL